MQAAQAEAEAGKPGKKEGVLKQPDDESLDPNQFYERRVKLIKAARDANVEPYPHKFHTTLEVAAYIAKYKGVKEGEHLEDTTESLAGKSPALVSTMLSSSARTCNEYYNSNTYTLYSLLFL